MLFKTFASLALAGFAAASKVIIANNKNFDDIVYNSNKASFVEFYASWCSHCKKLEPKLNDLATLYDKTSNVQIVKIECEENRVTCNQFNIGGFPTMKLFDGKKDHDPIDYDGKRNVDDFVRFIGNNVDDYVYIPKIQSDVVQVSDFDFEKTLLESGKTALVVFTASWCGHCKNLKPNWEQLATVFSGDDDVIISQVSTTDVPADELKAKYQIKGFPSILAFKPNDPTPVTYQYGRDIDTLVEWVNDFAGKARTTDGSLKPHFGRIEELDQKIAKLFKESPAVINGLASEIISEIREEGDENTKYYKKLLNKIVNGEDAFFEKETTRLNKLLKNAKSLSKDKIDSLQRRLNILDAFK